MRQYAVGDEPVPGYRLTRFLGKGGFGQVWEASAPGGVYVAIKLISLEGSEGLKEFRAIGLVKKLHDPNLIPLHGYWLRDSFGNLLDAAASGDSVNLRGQSKELIIAMGLGEKSLAQRLDECKREGLPGIPTDELLDHMAGAARAIDYLNEPKHMLGSGPPIAIQHCDIKPANLLIVGKGLQVCDYGLARALTNDVRATQGAGTPAYCAPEMFRNSPSPRTDQYSLAISYYELRTGRLPFEEREAINAHILGNLDLSLVPPPEREVLRKATHIRPDQRYTSTMDMVRALRDVVNQRPSGSQPTAVVGESPSKFIVTPSAAAAAISLDERIRGGNELVPGYKLVKLLGRGGYGEVWETRGPGGKHCALKIVRNLDAGQGRQEFKSLDLIRDLDHDRLIGLQAFWLLDAHGTVIHDDQFGQPNAPSPSVLVMATDLAAKNLLNRWQEYSSRGEPGIPAAELLRYMRQAAEAIDYLNAHAIQHRDIKPENILLTRDGRVKVSDFGLAKLVESAAVPVHSASVGLTAAYAAPELFGNTVTRWTDQYSLALTYYKLRTGHWPFPSDSGPFQMMRAHAEGKLEFNAVSEPERRVLSKGAALEPSARYNSCQEMVEDLGQALGIAVAAMPSGASTPVLSSLNTPVVPATPSDRPAAITPRPADPASTDTTAFVPAARAPAREPGYDDLQPTVIPGGSPSGTLNFTPGAPRHAFTTPRTDLAETDIVLPSAPPPVAATAPAPAPTSRTAKPEGWREKETKSSRGPMIAFFALLAVGAAGVGYVVLRPPTDPRPDIEQRVQQLVQGGKHAEADQQVTDAINRGIGDKDWADKLRERVHIDWRRATGDELQQLTKNGKHADADKLWADASGRGAGWKEWADANRPRRPETGPAEVEARAVVSGEVSELMRAGKYAEAARRASDAGGRGPDWKDWADKLHQSVQDDWRRAAGDEVAQRLKAGKYAEAATLVTDAAGRGAGWKPWADGQHKRIQGDWQAFARRETEVGRKVTILDAYLQSYKNDTAVNDERTRLLATIGSRDADRLFATLGQSLRDGQAEKAANTLADLQKLNLASADKQRLQALTGLVTQAKDANATPASVDGLDTIRQHIEGDFAGVREEDRQALTEFYRGLLGRQIQELVPKLSAETLWAKLREACRAAGSSPWALACRAECAAELRQPDGDDLATQLAAVTAPPDAALYARYAQARLAGTSDPKAAAVLLGQAYPAGAEPPPALANPYRLLKSVDLIERAVRGWRASAASGRRFDEANFGPAVAALKVARRLSERPGVAIDKDRRTQLALELVLAFRQKSDVDLQALAGPLSEELVQTDVLQGLLRQPADAYAVRVVHAQTRDTAVPGRRAAAASAAHALELVRQDPKLATPAQVANDLVRPILEPKVDDALPPDQPLKAITAARYATTARMIGANIKAWSTVAGIGDKAPDFVLQLFDRAIKLDGTQAKYPVQRAFAAIEQSKEPDLPAWRAAADRATKTIPDYAGGYILDGVVLLFESQQSDLGPDALTAKLTQADKRFEEALLTRAQQPEDKATALLGRSAAALRLANAAPRRAEVGKHLDAAAEFARKAQEEDKAAATLAWDALGLALEDRALLLGETDQFSKAVSAFVSAAGAAFGATRTKPALDLGRCEFRWAAATKDREMLGQAITDLRGVVQMAPSSALAVEANYFLGNALVTQADFLRAEKANEAQKALQEARAAFEAGAKLAADHKLVVWSEFVLFDRAKLDLDEAKRRLLTMPAAQRPTAAKTNSEFAALLSAAAAFADKLKPVNPARAALVLGQVTILKVDPNLATAKRNALDIFAGGLKVARPHDRWLRIDLLRERITLLDPTEDAATLAADRFTAYRLLTEVEAPADQRADMLALSALAQQAVYKTKRAPADRQEYLQRLRMAIREFPDHPNLWGWVYFAADELKNGTADEKAEAIKLLDLGMQKATPEQKVQLEQLKRSIKPGSP